VSVEDEIWYGAPTFKQAKRVFWRRLKQAIPAGCATGHTFRFQSARRSNRKIPYFNRRILDVAQNF